MYEYWEINVCCKGDGGGEGRGGGLKLRTGMAEKLGREAQSNIVYMPSEIK